MGAMPVNPMPMSGGATFANDVLAEMDRAVRKFGSFHSAHEGYAVLLEEVDELWDEVRKKREKRSKKNMRKECVQIAAMAMKFALCFGGEE